MDIDLSPEAVDFGRQARQALAAAGGDDLVQRAEAEPEKRGAIADSVLSDLGAWELDPRADEDELQAAAAICRSAGYWCLPYPVAERLARPADADGLVVVPAAAPAAPVAHLDLSWVAVTVDGRRFRATPRPPRTGPRDSAFVTDLDLEPLDDALDRGRADAALGLTLTAWTLLGMLDRAIDLARAHVTVRTQFGKHLSDFQGVQFQLTDAEVERSGVDMLARYALASTGSPDALTDALALRLAAVEAAQIVFRVSHQVHGATGFCDETPLSWLSRYSQGLRRFPLGPVAAAQSLGQVVGASGLTGLFSAPRVAS